MSAAKQATAVGHRSAPWVTSNAVPYLAAVGGGVVFALYSVTRSASTNPEIGKQLDIDADTSKEADSFKASPLRKAIAGDS